VASTQIRAEMGKLDLDQTFHHRQDVNEMLLRETRPGTDPWGVKVTRGWELPRHHALAWRSDRRGDADERERRRSGGGAALAGLREAEVNAAKGRAERCCSMP